MDEPVSLRRARRAAWLAVLALLASAPAWAQDLTDPTRPPAAPAPGAAAVAADGPVLQWVYVSPSRVEAMISGRRVRIGDSVGNAKVQQITEASVVLRGPAGLRTLRLYPVMEKRYAEGQQPSASGDRSKQQR